MRTVGSFQGARNRSGGNVAAVAAGVGARFP
jgi:hypothetical protein